MTIDDFDKIWCLHCIDVTERFETSKHEFEKVGILDKVEYRLTSLQPHVGLRQSRQLGHLVTESEYHCTREHYTMIKIAYYLNYDYILIFEDDVKLINKSMWDLFMYNIPNDFDILRLGGYAGPPFIKGPNLFNDNIYWSFMNFYLWGTTAYALSRKGMKYYLDNIDDISLKFPVADYLFWDIQKVYNNNLKCYISTLPVHYYYKFKSLVQKENDFWAKDKYYANIDMSIYE